MNTGDSMLHTQTEHEALQAAQPVQPVRERQSHLGKRMRYEGTRFPCEHCGASSEIRTSRMVSRSMRESIYACTNVECGYIFVVLSETVRGLSPSATPDPSVRTPLSSHIRRDMVRMVLDNAGESEHQARYTAPVTGDLFAGGNNTS